MTGDGRLAGAVLTIDLGAIADNWRRLARLVAPARCAGLVKANGYGLGAVPVARALAAAGCDLFFVAHASEGVTLRQALPEAEIMVLHGPPPGAAAELQEHRLVPVLSSPEQIAEWSALARLENRRLAAALHLDTGMNRLGLTAAQAARLSESPEALAGIELRLVMSHLACAEEADHPLNRRQLAAFEALRRRLPPAPASLANSAGIFLGRDFHFDLVRPGIALYGVDPRPGSPEKIRQAIELKARIIQIRDVDRGQTVGYGATHSVSRPGRVATIPVGYADGYLRTLSNRGHAYVADVRVPVVGRVSMDLITLDVTAVPPDKIAPGTEVELIGPHLPLGEVAKLAGTIEYELLTRLGPRFHRVYLGGTD